MWTAEVKSRFERRIVPSADPYERLFHTLNRMIVTGCIKSSAQLHRCCYAVPFLKTWLLLSSYLASGIHVLWCVCLWKYLCFSIDCVFKPAVPQISRCHALCEAHIPFSHCAFHISSWMSSYLCHIAPSPLFLCCWHQQTVWEPATIRKRSDTAGFLTPSRWELPVGIAQFTNKAVAPFQQMTCALISFLITFSSVTKGWCLDCRCCCRRGSRGQTASLQPCGVLLCCQLSAWRKHCAVLKVDS